MLYFSDFEIKRGGGVAIELIKGFNWVDLIILVVFLRILFVAYRTGLIIELFKLIGAFLAVFFSLHYYSRISDTISSVITLSAESADVISLIFLTVVIIIAFKFVREAFFILFKIEPKSIIDKWGAMILGIFRASLISGLVIMILFFTSSRYIKNSVTSSIIGKKILNFSPRVYSSCFKGIVVKLFPKEKLNTSVFFQ